ncbi:hypothetical protein NST67_16660 [Bacillus sp. FSL W7-1321]
MGSRIMHLAISSIICTKLKFEKEFLLGGLAPDVQQQGDSTRFNSHFMKQTCDGEYVIYFKKFFFKYNEEFDDDFVKGYYSHLIADKYWLEGPYKKYVRPKSLTKRKSVLKDFYHDYQILNSFLIEKYNLEKLTLKILPENKIIEEIDYAKLPIIIKETNIDFNYYVDLDKLKILGKDEITNYIDSTAEALIQMFINQ